MDTQIWYAIYYTIIGGIYGAFSHLGEVSGYFTLVFFQVKRKAKIFTVT